ncbi:hypothetical protein Gotur_023627 [Gossypium turneri]
MHIVRGLLMPNVNGDNVHLMYLPLLADLSTASSYSWGSAILVMLRWELCRATNPDVVDMGGCLILLQSWALYRLPILASVSHQPYVYPLLKRWSVRPGIRKSYTVSIYRLMIEQYAREEFQRSRVVSRRLGATTVWLHPTYPGSVVPGGGSSRHD